MSRTTVVITVDESREIGCRPADSKDIAIDGIMQDLFGEDWEIQMNDEEWELSSEIGYAFDQLDQDGQYTDRDGMTWKVFEV